MATVHVEPPIGQDANGSANFAPEDRAILLARQFGVCRRSIFNCARFAVAVDAVAERSETIKAAILAGKCLATTEEITALAMADQAMVELVVALIEAGDRRAIKRVTAVPKKTKPRTTCPHCGGTF